MEMAPLADPAVEDFPIPFLPQDSELLDCLLRPKIAGDRIDSRFTALVHDADVYSLPPDQLAARHEGAPGSDGDKVWYFFSGAGSSRGGGGRRACTVGGDGSKRWCSVGSKKKVEGGVPGGGYCQKLRYKEKTASGVVAPGWTMVEYGVAQELAGGADLVLCKIFRSPRAARSESDSSTSASASPSCSGGRKRKAAE
ncbi:hypothetical protein E2562_036266 [Oryza meyeriana var. granulata]|uniref:NAC domain-containing protein n=1 Tax=Oryza meyeriana var. granulata TaxID=110450 RepID=A0A6G1D9M6_9ORYZ|nr:hypothetical protein E2562_036266 [Oryza meyeriana var. granulata]